MRLIFTLLFAVGATTASAQIVRTYGVKINVTDLAVATDFYCAKLGFEIESKSGDFIFLKSGRTKLMLHKVPHFLAEGDRETRAGLTLQVNDLDQSIASLRSKGVDFGHAQKRKEGVGYAIYVKDPFGKDISLMHQTITKVEPFAEPKIYNYGFRVPDMQQAIDFYCNKIGFREMSQKYLPYDMPLLHADNSFGFMLHFREGTEPLQHNSSDNQHIVILFKTDDLHKAIVALKDKGVRLLQKKPQQSPLGRYISFYDPFGYLSEAIEVKRDLHASLQSLVDAEVNFATTARDVDVKTAFEQNLDDSSVVFEKGNAVNGKETVKGWSVSKSNYLYWWPLVADISSSGTMGYTTGPCEWGTWNEGRTAPTITGGGYYATVWQKDNSGVWKIATDLGAGIPDPADKDRKFRVPAIPEATIDPSINLPQEKSALLQFDQDYNKKLNASKSSFFPGYLTSNARLHRSGEKPFATPESIQQNVGIEKDVEFSFEHVGGNIASSADLGYTYGNASFRLEQDGKIHNVKTNYMRVWKREGNLWKIALDVVQ